MRIDSKNPQPLQRSLSERKTPTPAASSEAPAAAEPAVIRLVSQVGTSSGNAARVQQLRQEIAEGRYRVDYDELASKIADDELSRHGSDQ